MLMEESRLPKKEDAINKQADNGKTTTEDCVNMDVKKQMKMTSGWRRLPIEEKCYRQKTMPEKRLPTLE